uniref:Uncharacterized protein n=1 Tax=Ciona savignyi TaxID=51511 RepID=H2YPQ4_CIOSA
MLSPLQQPQPYAHGHLMYGAGPTYQPLAAHYPGYAYPAAACAGQPCSTVHLPWPPTPIGGACGQLISPAVSQSTPEQLNVVTLPTQAVPTGYLVPRSVPSAAQTQVHPIPNRPPEAVVDKPLYTPTSEPVRVLVASPTYGHPQIMPSQPMYHQQSIKCAHAQYAPYAVDPSTAHYVTLHENEPTGIPHPVVTSEGELLTPPLTPEQQNQ